MINNPTPRWFFCFLCILLPCFLQSACSAAKQSAIGGYQYKVKGKTYQVRKSAKGYKARGVASWYGKGFHGKKAANGSRYNMYALTAAHKTLPLNTYVKVTHLKNHKSITVKITDRGPFKSGRIIDLSYKAAKKLGIDKTGTALVEVKALS